VKPSTIVLGSVPRKSTMEVLPLGARSSVASGPAALATLTPLSTITISA
jgi:hypothetical protein